MRKSPLLSVKNEENMSISVKKQRKSVIFSPSCPTGDKDLFELSQFYLLGTGFPKNYSIFFFDKSMQKFKFARFPGIFFSNSACVKLFQIWRMGENHSHPNCWKIFSVSFFPGSLHSDQLHTGIIVFLLFVHISIIAASYVCSLSLAVRAPVMNLDIQ